MRTTGPSGMTGDPCTGPDLPSAKSGGRREDVAGLIFGALLSES